MSVTIRQLAELVQGQVDGDADLAIAAARAVTEAAAGDITFIENEKHLNELRASAASAAIADATLPACGKTLIRVKDPLTAFIAVVRHLHGRAEPAPCGIDPRASVHPTAVIGADASVMPFAAIGEGAVIGARCKIHSGAAVGRFCKLGDDVTLFPNAVLYDDTVLGHGVIVHANAVLGADGFGYRLQGGKHVKVPQLGRVEIGDDVEVGACTTIDRGTFTATRIGAGTKLDNLVQVGHNCQVGKHNLLCSQVGIAGSSATGEYVVMAGQVGLVDHIRIGDRVMIGGQAGVTKDVAAGQHILGSPATPERDQKRILMSLERLPEMRKDLRRVMQHLGLNDEEEKKSPAA